MSAQAQTSGSKWMQEVRDYKHEMLVEEAEMTADQQEAFLPLYTAMEEEIMQLNEETRGIEADITASSEEIPDSVYQAAAQAMASLKLNEAQIEERYYAQFEQILSSKQLFLLKRAEKRFTSDMLKHNRQGKSQKSR